MKTELPPLCPGTEDFFKDVLGEVCYDDHAARMCVPLDELRGRSRIIIGRVEACAWQDRAKRYGKVRGDRAWFTPPWLDARRVEMECLENADAWREWEKEK